MQRFQGQKAKIPFFAGKFKFKNGYFDAGFAFAWAYVHLKFERKRCFWCRDRAPEPVFTKIGLKNNFLEIEENASRVEENASRVDGVRTSLRPP